MSDIKNKEIENGEKENLDIHGQENQKSIEQDGVESSENDEVEGEDQAEIESNEQEEITVRPLKSKVLGGEHENSKRREEEKRISLIQRKEKRNFWIFTIIVTIITIAAVLVILFHRGILGGGKETEVTLVSPSTATSSSLTDTLEASSTSVTSSLESEEESTETIDGSAEVSSEEKSQSSTEETSEEVSQSTSDTISEENVLQNYTNLFIADRVTTDSVNIRKEPYINSDIVAVLNANGGGSVLSAGSEGWYEVSSGGITGYISGELISIGADAEKKALDYATKRVKVTADSLNVRAGAAADAAVIDSVSKGSVWLYVETEGDFYKIVLSDGLEGYISSGFSTLGVYLDEAVEYQE